LTLLLRVTAWATSTFAGHRWPAERILTAVRWSLSHPLSATSVVVCLAERAATFPAHGAALGADIRSS
jgi:hypothetical protein